MTQTVTVTTSSSVTPITAPGNLKTTLDDSILVGVWSTGIPAIDDSVITATPGTGGTLLVQFSSDSGATWFNASNAPYTSPVTEGVPPGVNLVRATATGATGTLAVATPEPWTLVAQNPAVAAVGAANIVPRKGPAAISFIARGIIGQFSDGSYLAFDEWPGAGEGSARLSRFTTDPATSTVSTALTQTSALAANALANASGVVVGNAANSLTNAWITSTGDVYFVMVGLGNFYFLYRAKASTYTVGSDAGYSNKRACIDIGLYAGVQADQVRAFNQRAFLEARVNGAIHLYYCEYNTSPGRVPGSGGAGKDQVIAYRSTDSGLTWSVFLEFNTGGVHEVDHFHGAVQDPYTGWIYFMTGDSGSECALIAYNGTAAAPAANTPLATLATTAGWRVINGNELCRYTDLSFDQYGVLSMPDCDTETAEAATTAFVCTRIPRTLDFVASVAAAQRFPDIPPCQIVSSATYGNLMVSFRTESSNTTNEPYIYLWSANVEEGTWTLIAKLQTKRAVTGVPRSLFIDTQGRLWISATYKGGLNFLSALVSTATTSSACVTLGPRLTTYVTAIGA